MNTSLADSVVFSQGAIEVKGESGVATVIAEEDITLGMIQSELETVMLAVAEEQEASTLPTNSHKESST